jgi:subtilase family serine protease
MFRVSILFLSLMMVSCAFFSHYTIDAAESTTLSAILPDLAVIHAQNTLYPTTCMGACSDYVLLAIIENKGSADAPAFDVMFNGERVHSESIPAGQRITLTTPISDPVSSTISVVIDPDNAILERDETNNRLTTITMTLTPPLPCQPGVCQ